MFDPVQSNQGERTHFPEPGVKVTASADGRQWRVVSDRQNIDQTFRLITKTAIDPCSSKKDLSVFACKDNRTGEERIYTRNHDSTLETCRRKDRQPLYHDYDEDKEKEVAVYETFNLPNFGYSRPVSGQAGPAGSQRDLIGQSHVV